MDAYSAAQSVVHSAGYWEVQLVAHLAEYLADLMEALSATSDLYKRKFLHVCLRERIETIDSKKVTGKEKFHLL